VILRRLLAPLACLLVCVAASKAASDAPPQVRVILRPALARLGERVTYRAEVIGALNADVTWLAPDSGSAFSWGEPRHGLSHGRARQWSRFGDAARRGQVQGPIPDTAWVEIPLQVFELGVVSIPGIGLRYMARSEIGLANGVATTMESGRAPTARLIVTPVLTAADSNATLRPLHGPLAAPWWERIPWIWVAAALALLALVILVVRALRRRRTVAPQELPAKIPLSPAAAALEALAELRALDLPRQQRFAEHAFRLGQILRRFLEATVAATHPGDTTPELVRHLGEAGLSAEDVKRLAGLLRVWDRVKFAREPFTYDEAVRAEGAVEGYVRRAVGTASEKAA
jgi:Domain of unknown function (DUF4381)